MQILFIFINNNNNMPKPTARTPYQLKLEC